MNRRMTGPFLPSLTVCLVFTLVLQSSAAASDPPAADLLGTPESLGDLRTTAAASSSDAHPVARTPATLAPGVEASERAFFIASDEVHGSEMWVLDEGGTPSRMTDLCPGPCDSVDRSHFTQPARLGDGVIFHGQDGDRGIELWFATESPADGTRAVRLTDRGRLNPIDIRRYSIGQAPLNGLVYFAWTEDGVLWVTDGTPEGTRPFDPAAASEIHGQINEIHRVGDHIVFSADDFGTDDGSRLGREWWTTDGTVAGTEVLVDFCPGPCSTGNPRIGGIGRDAEGRHEVLLMMVATGDRWAILSTQGTPESTETLLDICSGEPLDCDPRTTEFAPVRDRLAFGIDDTLWITDGTVPGTFQAAAFAAGTFGETRVSGVGPAPGGLVALVFRNLETEIHFIPMTGDQAGTPALLGTAEGFVDDFGAMQPDGPIVFRTTMDYLTSQTWASDGTQGGTIQLPVDHRPGIETDPTYIVPWQDRLVFGGFDSEHGQELYVSDGTALGTERLADLAGTSQSSYAREYTPLTHRKVLFVVDVTPTFDTRVPQEAEGAGDLFVTDGDDAQPILLDRRARDLVSLGHRAFFVAVGEEEDPKGGEPWITDGTAAGTRLLADLEPGDGGSHPRDPILVSTDEGPRIVFFAEQGPGVKVWSSDGTPGGTELVTDLDPSWTNHFPEPVPSTGSGKFHEVPVYPRDARRLGDGALFVGRSRDVGIELFFTDGTEEGTRLFADLTPGPGSSDLFHLTQVGERVFFVEEDLLIPPRIDVLWIADADGIHEVAPLRDRKVKQAVSFASAQGLRLAFITTPAPSWVGPRVEEVWISDGKAAGTFAIHAAPRIEYLAPADHVLYFAEVTDEAGTELAVTDGTVAGTRSLGDLRPGPQGSEPRVLETWGHRAIVSVNLGDDAGNSDPSLVVFDGTPGGELLPAAASGSYLSWPSAARVAHDRLFVSANEPSADSGGIEPWTFDLPGGACVQDDFHACLDDRFRVSVDWLVTTTGESGTGHPIPGTDDTAFFWFFGEENLELAVKILDGTGINDHHWVFYGALSDVQYTLRVEDILIGAVQTYTNEAGNLCGNADVQAFPELPVSTSAVSNMDPSPARTATTREVSGHRKDSCAGPLSLCLQDRFQLSTVWQTPDAAGNAMPIPFGDETGMFWFFGPENVELLVKILDGRSINGKFWVFYGALSDVGYTIRVVDTETGAEQTYDNVQGNLCGNADVEAFDGRSTAERPLSSFNPEE